jgi:hypothetical protein
MYMSGLFVLFQIYNQFHGPALSLINTDNWRLGVLIVLYRLHSVACIISYGCDRQHDNKAECFRVKIKTDVDICIFYLM